MSDLSERMLRAFLIQMVRSEAIDPDDLIEAAEALDKEGDEEAAHAMRCIPLAAAAPDASDWQADQRRARFRVIEQPEGGKPD